MSLTVYLVEENFDKTTGGSGIFVREDGRVKEISRAEWDEKFPGREPVVAQVDNDDNVAFDANITGNLGKMADEAGIYECLWNPAPNSRASELVATLEVGLIRLKLNPEYFKQFNPPNEWGSYESLVKFVEEYLRACKRYPNALVKISK
jgi:hypothetical protein